ncbi:MAG TPA: putative Se/S carrier-like protein [Candidatus Aquilonibacter sp.]
MSDAVTGVVLYFGTNADTMIAGKALRDANIEARMMPKPASVTSEANLVLSVSQDVEQRAAKAIANAGVAIKGVIK